MGLFEYLLVGVIIFLVVCIISVSVLIYFFKTAPKGYEENGYFYRGEKPSQ